MEFSIYFEKNSCEKRNASIRLGIDPRTFRLPIECFIIWATEAIERSWARYPAEWKRSFFHRIFFIKIEKFLASVLKSPRKNFCALLTVTIELVLVQYWQITVDNTVQKNFTTWANISCPLQFWMPNPKVAIELL